VLRQQIPVKQKMTKMSIHSCCGSESPTIPKGLADYGVVSPHRDFLSIGNWLARSLPDLAVTGGSHLSQAMGKYHYACLKGDRIVFKRIEFQMPAPQMSKRTWPPDESWTTRASSPHSPLGGSLLNDAGEQHLLVVVVWIVGVVGIKSFTEQLWLSSNSLALALQVPESTKSQTGAVGCPMFLRKTQAVLTGKEPPEITQYKKLNPDFPHETTADQWFSESQFESYRALGYFIACKALGQKQYSTIEELFDHVRGAVEGGSPD
jgi:hypothetical protein